tara:strand:- start:279 stop:614 length:336 start_codon:yes stop_codon:yes gene_type:complete
MKRSLLAPLFLIISGCSNLPMMNQSQDYIKTSRYSDFIDAVQKKEISRVLISPDNATAQVIREDGVRYEVNLAPDKDLLKILTENNVDIAVTPIRIKKGNPFKEFLNYFLK